MMIIDDIMDEVNIFEDQIHSLQGESQNEIYDGQSKGANVGVDGRDWTFPFWDEGHVL